jgi:molybdopterin converting factor subunit 1
MQVRVLFFGTLRDLLGKNGESLEVPEGGCVRDVIAGYELQNPRLKQLLPSIALAVNQHYASPETKLKANDEVALLPPVSGGADIPAAITRQVCSITRDRIRTKEIVDSLKQGEDGAALAFEGIVRNQTRGRKTLYLDYEAYEPMALGEMKALAAEALGRFQIRDVAIVHRLGRVQIGETSVLVAVTSAHRTAAFEACRWLIDTLKKKVPIWKKEYFEDGAVWADGDPFPPEIPRATT